MFSRLQIGSFEVILHTFVEKDYNLIEGPHEHHIGVAELLYLEQKTQFAPRLCRKRREKHSVRLEMSECLISYQFLKWNYNYIDNN